MKRRLFNLIVEVRDDETAFLFRSGRFERALPPGRHAFFDPAARLSVETFKVARAEFAPERHAVLARVAPDVARDLFEPVATGPGEIAIVSLDGLPGQIVPPSSTRVFWTAVTKVDVERFDAARDPRLPSRAIDLVSALPPIARSTAQTLVQGAVVESHEAALLFVDGVASGRLEPGRHAFWQANRVVRIAKYDLRPQLAEITAKRS